MLCCWRRLGLIALSLCVCIPSHSVAADNLVKNPGFEVSIADGSWYLNPQLAGNGLILQSAFGRHSGRRSLKVIPNANNTGTGVGGLFGLSQVLPEVYVNQPLYFGGWMAAEGGAIATLRLVVVSFSGAVYFRELRQPIQTRTSMFFRDVIDIPNDPSIFAVFMTCSALGTTGGAYFDDLFVTQGNPTDWPAATGKPDPGPDLDGIVEVDSSRVIRRIPREIYGTNVEWIWGGQGLVLPNSSELNQTLVDLASQAGFSLLRFPAGFFSDFYNWKNGVGPKFGRPLVFAFPAVNSGLSSNDFGTDEALELADKIGGQLLITVNAVTGSPEEAADWVRYVNKDSQRVKYWEVGNELYVNLTAFDPALNAIPPAAYASRYLQYAQAMRAADPSIKIGAILDFNYGLTTYKPFPDWADTVLSQAGPQIDFVSVHNAFAPAIGGDVQYPVRAVYASMLAAPLAVKSSLYGLNDLIIKHKGPNDGTGIVVSEWGPLFEANPASPFIDHSKTLGSALYVAHVLKLLAEDQRVVAANAFKFVDRLPNGWIGERDGQFVAKAPLLALQLFARRFGQTAVETQTNSPGYGSRSMGWVDATPFVPYLEAASSLGDDGKLYVLMINKNFDRNMRANVRIKDFCPSGAVHAWTLNGTAIDANTGTTVPDGFALQVEDAYNGRFHSGGPSEVQITESDFTVAPGVFDYTLAPHSVVSLAIEGKPSACPEPANDPGVFSKIGHR
jgi:alpha-L-arabinofuranosidase